MGKVTLDPDGLRLHCGIRVLLVVATIAAGVAVHHVAPGAPKWLFPIFHGATWIAGVALVTWLVRVKINKADRRGMALPPPQVGRLALGLALGGLVLWLAFVVQHELGWVRILRIDSLTEAGPRIALALFPSLTVGFSEELAFRGFVFQTLAERMPVWAAAGLSTAIFAANHLTLGGFGPGVVATVVCLARVFTVLRIVTGSLWLPIGLHAARDWTQTYPTGLANVGQSGHDPALVKVSQSGPSFWVGQAPAIEGGVLYAIIAIGALAAALAYNVQRGHAPGWTRRLNEYGDTLGG